jgi:hypothetical protein
MITERGLIVLVMISVFSLSLYTTIYPGLSRFVINGFMHLRIC